MAKTSKTGRDEIDVVSPQLMDAAKDYVFRPKPAKRVTCRICSEPATGRADGLCWICQHLKISAWRDSDAQGSAAD
ncbi:MAG: hypothetical protein OXD30_00045 [Bryobacterales bacterium]|nr:hypothetical protein [Bryobacterales bacterium]